MEFIFQGLMGEANLRFAKGDQETAIKMCMEVIRQDPAAPEPFQTLSTIYDTSGEFEKSVQFAVIGAHLAPPDADEWERLANMSLELGKMHALKKYDQLANKLAAFVKFQSK